MRLGVWRNRLVGLEPCLAPLGKGERVLRIRLPRYSVAESCRREEKSAIQQLCKDECIDQRFPLCGDVLVVSGGLDGYEWQAMGSYDCGSPNGCRRRGSAARLLSQDQPDAALGGRSEARVR